MYTLIVDAAYPFVLLFLSRYTATKCTITELSQQEKEELQRTITEQASMIDSLKKDKLELEGLVGHLKTDNDRAQKENHLLRKAINIQQDRYKNVERDLKHAQKQQGEAEASVRKLEQIVLSLRYHLQAQQSGNMANDFMGLSPRPPDVF
jgi:chromosome segregation ATPase